MNENRSVRGGGRGPSDAAAAAAGWWQQCWQVVRTFYAINVHATHFLVVVVLDVWQRAGPGWSEWTRFRFDVLSGRRK